MQQLVIIDSGGYNLGSIQTALSRLGANASISADADTIQAATHVILPGVGHAAVAMQKLRAAGLDRLIPQLQQPVLGICLGMQLMFAHSAEGDTRCLGIFDGEVTPLIDGMAEQDSIRVPHMGWNQLQWRVEADQPEAASLFKVLPEALPEPAWMYFVHSFAAPVTSQTVASAQHGKRFAALTQHNNFIGAQFHPERSAAAGQALLRYFLQLS